jgi:hypothetical protein
VSDGRGTPRAETSVAFVVTFTVVVAVFLDAAVALRSFLRGQAEGHVQWRSFYA